MRRRTLAGAAQNATSHIGQWRGRQLARSNACLTALEPDLRCGARAAESTIRLDCFGARLCERLFADTGRPASTHAAVKIACESADEAMTTASMSHCSNCIDRRYRDHSVCTRSSRNFSTRREARSVTTSDSTLGIERSVVAWNEPMLPRPMTPNLMRREPTPIARASFGGGLLVLRRPRRTHPCSKPRPARAS